MSIRAVSRHKKTSKSFLNQPIQYRQIIRHRNSHQAVNPFESYSNTPKSRIRQSQNSQSRLQKLLRKSPVLLQTPLQKSKQMVFQSEQRQRKSLSKNDSNTMVSLKRTLTTSIKKFKEEVPVSYNRMNTICTQKAGKQQQKLQLKQIKLQQGRTQPKKFYNIDEINQKLQNLVTRKLKLVLKQTQKHNDISSSIINIMKENINQELMSLIQTIKSLKNSTKGTELQLLNQKIYFIQTLLAEQTTERELMKKYYYKLTSNKKKGKIGDFNHFRLSISDIYKQIFALQKQKKDFKSSQSRAKPLIEASINRQAYKKPSLSDYESYRYKQKNFAPNLQPLPRSSYKRQFLYLKSSPDEKIVSKDHSPYNPFTKGPITSIYDKDYKSIKTEIVDHKELDAYKNKIKTLKVNYMPKNKFESVSIDRESYIKDMLASSRAKSPQIIAHKASENEINYNRHMFKSEAHRSFMAEQIYERSQIKHHQLKQFQYRLKKMFKA